MYLTLDCCSVLALAAELTDLNITLKTSTRITELICRHHKKWERLRYQLKKKIYRKKYIHNRQQATRTLPILLLFH